jgi:hypothetical protein
MRVLRVLLQFALITMSFLFIACTSTKFSAMWKDETYQGHPEKILVINAFPDPANRRLFEDKFVKALKDRRIDAIMSYTIMPDPAVSDKDAIAALAKEVGADTVLVNKPLGTTKDLTYAPGGYSYGRLALEDLYVNTQTDVYDMKSNRLILSVSAETWVRQGKPYPDQIQSFVKDLVNQLSRLGLF